MATFDETIVVANDIPNFDNVGIDRIFKNFDGLFHSTGRSLILGPGTPKAEDAESETHLRERNASREELDQIASLEDDVWIKRLPSRLDRHGTLDQIQRRRDTLLRETERKPQVGSAPTPPSLIAQPRRTCLSNAETTCPQISLR